MPQLTSRYCSALTFAAELHRDQCRKKTTIPYVAHLLAVSSLALEQGADEDEAIAALLHDAGKHFDFVKPIHSIKSATEQIM